MNMTLKYLKYFVTAAKCASFSRAAEELHVSKSSVIAAVTKLEEEFNFDLFIRQPSRGLILTPSGKQALQQASFILEEIAEFQNEISEIPNTLKGTLSIGCFSTFSSYFMPSMLVRLRKAHPQLDIDIYETDLPSVYKLLLQGEIDAILTYDFPKPPNEIVYERHRLASPYALMSTEHPLANKPIANLEELSDYPMILLNLP